MTMPDQSKADIDLQNRKIEQEARHDSDLETVVPPTSPFGWMTTWWRAGAALVGIIVIVLIIAQAL
ncbi:MAG: hypothetical protein KAH44_28470 [Oricola sp.]|nr:hypothetical protein [Oricola sp.]